MILITGAAGFIGSHMTAYLLEHGQDCLGVDISPKPQALALPDQQFINIDLRDLSEVQRLFQNHQIDSVMHFAGSIQVGESVDIPLTYYKNNIQSSINLLDAMLQHEVKYFIFSSTAAVYGNPEYTPIDTKHPTFPINPYGRSKLMVENILADVSKANGICYAALRYFNACGAHPNGLLGENHQPETHLLPIILEVAKGVRPQLEIYGDDYDTPDGTCIRDYIHVMDLAQAHWLALNYIKQHNHNITANLGTGKGYSNLEIVKTVEAVTQNKVNYKYSARRLGDPGILVADGAVAMNKLNWELRYSDLATIINTQWQFLSNIPSVT